MVLPMFLLCPCPCHALVLVLVPAVTCPCPCHVLPLSLPIPMPMSLQCPALVPPHIPAMPLSLQRDLGDLGAVTVTHAELALQQDKQARGECPGIFHLTGAVRIKEGRKITSFCCAREFKCSKI